MITGEKQGMGDASGVWGIFLFVCLLSWWLFFFSPLCCVPDLSA